MLMLLCDPPVASCFDLAKMLSFVRGERGKDAIRVILQATAILESAVVEVAENAPEFLSIWVDCPNLRPHVCCIISNCISLKEKVASRFLLFVPHFCDPALADASLAVTVESSRALASILRYSGIPLDGDRWAGDFERLVAMLAVPNEGMQAMILDLLYAARWRSPAFVIALRHLSDGPLGGIAKLVQRSIAGRSPPPPPRDQICAPAQ
jgi:hypothetical protein